MKKFLILMLVMSILALAGCLRPASTPPAGTPAGDTIPFPFTASTPMTKDIMSQTATALAQTVGGTTPLVAPTVNVNVIEPTQAPANPTSTAVPAVIPTVEVPSSYTLQKGEFAFCIARRFNVDPGELLSLNGLSTNTLVQPGTTLEIPTGTSCGSQYGSRSLLDHPTTYTVSSGDTIYSVSCKFGDVDPSGIIAANNLAEPYTLTAGSTIQIP